MLPSIGCAWLRLVAPGCALSMYLT